MDKARAFTFITKENIHFLEHVIDRDGNPLLIRLLSSITSEPISDDLVKIYLYRRMDPQVKGSYGKTAFYLCLHHTKKELMIPRFLRYNLDLLICDFTGQTPFHGFFGSGNNNTELVNHMLEQGININIKDGRGRTILHYASSSYVPGVVNVFWSMSIQIFRIITDKHLSILHTKLDATHRLKRFYNGVLIRILRTTLETLRLNINKKKRNLI